MFFHSMAFRFRGQPALPGTLPRPPDGLDAHGAIADSHEPNHPEGADPPRSLEPFDLGAPFIATKIIFTQTIFLLASVFFLQYVIL